MDKIFQHCFVNLFLDLLAYVLDKFFTSLSAADNGAGND